MKKETKSRLMVFFLSWFVYIGLTSFRDWQEILAGLVVAFIVTMLAGQFLIHNEAVANPFKRISNGLRYFFVFLWEMAKANLHVAYIVLHPSLPIKPGIVKINTKLKKDTSITVLTNSITLTPGTLTVDLNSEKGALYIHWIDVRSKDVQKNTEEIGGRFEKLLMEVFE